MKFSSLAAIFNSMITQSTTPTNHHKIVQLRATLAEVLGETLRRGFYGRASVELQVQDGTIQDIRRRIERIER
ncbi:MAG: hypothetical protein JW888_15615 [Pirellulales bacterium]|nr:hypothetical protein [Pirellulales bacterium]